ncbi:MAG TPA: hypothetical protein VFV94_09260 [Polyangiaceae bacterium]|nr:hypothetical protein [Polyangiaceae bacterium]
MRRLPLAWALFALSLLGCAQKPPPPAHAAPARFGKVEGRPDAKAWLPPSPGSQAEVLAVEGGVAGDRITSLLEVPEGDCAIAIARATPSVDDVDLFAYGEDGAVLGSDESSDKAPALLVCPPHPRRILIMARIAAGHGLVAIGAERVAIRDAERAARVYGVRYHPGEIAKRMALWPGLDEKLEQHRQRVGGRWIDLRRVAVPLDARTPTRVSASIEAERCLDVLVAPSDEVTAVDVVLLGEDGTVLGRAQAEGRDRSLVVCSPTPASVSLELRPHLGIGVAVLILSRSDEGSEADIDADTLRLDVFAFGSVAEERKRHDREQAARGYPAPRVVASGSLPLGRRLSYPLELPEGCVRLDWISGTPLRGVEAWLYAPDGALWAAEGGKNPQLFRCGPKSNARLDVSSLSRPGPFALELYAEPGTPKALDKYPLAASRLLSRMASQGLIASAKQVGAVYEAQLTSTALARQALTLPFGRCLDVTLAVGPGAASVELRLVRADGNELGIARGRSATSLHVCAVDGSTGTAPELIAEMRVLAGAATGLLTAHQGDPRPRAP